MFIATELSALTTEPFKNLWRAEFSAMHFAIHFLEAY